MSDWKHQVDYLTEAILLSGMFSCENEYQARVIAVACLNKRVDPLQLHQDYHLVGGKLQMKADVVLAKFRAAGNRHTIKKRTAEEARIELQTMDQKQVFAFTWEEAKEEDFVWAKDSKKKPLADRTDGDVHHNYKTPRKRMQMLWARVVTDAVRAIAPETGIAGHYEPADLEAAGLVPALPAPAEAVTGDVQDAEFTAGPSTETAAAPGEGGQPSPAPKTHPPVEAAIGATTGETQPVERSRSGPSTPEPDSPYLADASDENIKPCDEQAVAELKRLIVAADQKSANGSPPSRRVKNRLVEVGLEKLASLSIREAKFLRDCLVADDLSPFEKTRLGDTIPF